MTISTITINAVDYTSYASVAEADPYLAVDPTRSVTWSGLTDDQKGGFLVAATRRFDLLNWQGEKTGDADVQENQFPRTGLTYADGTAVSTSEVPQQLENATILLAGSIAIDSTKADYGTSGTNIKAVGAGSARVQFFQPKSGLQLQDETAYQLIKQFLEAASIDSGVGALASGTDGESSFSDLDNWGRGEGFP